MKRRPYFVTLTILLLVQSISPAGVPPQPATELPGDPPNIVFILADDLGCRDLSNEGSTFYETPNIDKIALQGVKFTRGYAACQVCSPSRASILTGTYPTKHGITTWIGDRVGDNWTKAGRHDSHMPPEYERNLRSSEITLPELLKSTGYTTFFAGKWHLGSKGSWPTDHGFDINKGGWDVGSPNGGYFAPWTNPNLESGPAGESLPIRLANETANFIEQHQEGPFLAYLSFYSVHGPIQTSPELWDKYRRKAAEGGLVDERFVFDRRLGVRQIQDCPIYGGMMESMDDAVGIVLDRLDTLGLAENTIVCFTSDNGGVSSGDAFATSNLPLRGGKGRQWEGGIREPFYIRGPGIKPAICDTPVSGIDWYPTLAELAGATVPERQAVDGISLRPLLHGGNVAQRDLFWHYPHYGNQGGEPSSIVLRGDWKLIHYHEDGHDELYNVAKDLGEQDDLSAEQSGLAAAMRARLDAWFKATNANFPEPDPTFDEQLRQRRWKDLSTKGIQRLEKQHAGFLSPDYQPNKDWWGSTPD